MDFPINEYMDEDACYAKLIAVLHPDGLACPRCQGRDQLKVHRRHRAPVLDYRCGACGRVFNAFTGTEFHKTHRRPSEILLILRGIAQGVSTARMARELGRHRPHLLRLRHRLQALALKAADPSPLEDDPAVEADEMYQNAGEKGIPHPDPDDPPRRREQASRPWQLCQRPPAGGRGGRARLRRAAGQGGGAGRSGDPHGIRRPDGPVRGDGLYRREFGLCQAQGAGVGPREGVPLGGRVGAGRRRRWDSGGA